MWLTRSLRFFQTKKMIILLLLTLLSLPVFFILYKYAHHLYLCWKFRNVPGDTQFLPGQIAALLPSWLYKAHLRKKIVDSVT